MWIPNIFSNSSVFLFLKTIFSQYYLKKALQNTHLHMRFWFQNKQALLYKLYLKKGQMMTIIKNGSIVCIIDFKSILKES